MKSILYHSSRTESSCVKWLIHELEELGIKEYIIKNINLELKENQTKEFLEMNLHGTVPILITKQQDILTELSSILLSISFQYSKYLLPSNLDLFFQYISYSSKLNEDIKNLVKEMKDEKKFVLLKNKIKKRLEYLELIIIEDFIFDKFSTTDIAIGYSLILLKHLDLLKDYPTLEIYLEKLSKRKAFITTFNKEFS